MVSTETRGGAVRQSPSAGFCCSVVVPVFNGAKDLGRLLVLLENQSTESSGFEVIVCDDGSTESCRSVVAEFQRSFPSIRYLRQDIRGAAAAKNMGILHAKSDVVVFLNSDVEPDRHLIARLTTALAENPDWHGAESRLLPVGEMSTGDVNSAKSGRSGVCNAAAVAYRTTALRLVGGLDENFPGSGCEGLELADRVLELGTIGFVPGAIVHQRPSLPTVLSCWQARKNWRFVRILASRHGCLSQPNARTQFPRLQTAVAAAVWQPLRRVWSALRLAGRAPGDSVRGVMLSVVDWVGGVSMIPVILFEVTPPRLSSVAPGDVSETVTLVARAS